jgi:hypothetical protein
VSARQPDVSVRVLRALTREAASMDLPVIDWDRVERKLFAGIDDPPEAVPLVPPPSSAPAAEPARPGSVWAVAVTAAAAVALVTASHSSPSTATESLSEASVAGSSARAVDTIPRGAAESGVEPLSYHRPDVVSFTLAPQSRIEMVPSVDASSVTVSLVRGSIEAEVTPRVSGEAFAVEIGHTRVAAHGTSFTVTRQGEHALVEIRHGSVAIGPTGHAGSTQGWLLVGPDRALFSLDGAQEARWLGPPTPLPRSAMAAPAPPTSVAATEPAHAPHASSIAAPIPAPKLTAPVPGAAAPAAAEEKRPAPEVATLAEPVDPRGLIQRELEACYDKQVSALGFPFSIESSLHLTVLPNGTVREGVFTPPLSPSLMSCARDAIAGAHFAHTDGITQVSIPIRLSRP